MERFRGHPVRLEQPVVAGRSYDVLAPARGEALLDDPRVVARFEQDEYMPYWAMLWPAAMLLADEVAKWPVPEGHDGVEVLEIGCGLGLATLVATARGYHVTATDHDEDALAFVTENARRNGLPPVVTRFLDWNSPAGLPRADRVIAADVLYEARNLEPVADLVRRCLKEGGQAVICDPNRRTADAFEAVARAQGLSVRTESVMREAAPGGVPIHGRLFRLGDARAGVSGER